MRIRLRIALVPVFASVFATAALVANAQTPAFAPVARNSGYVSDAAYTEGYTFSLTTAMNVTALGFYDYQQNGLVQSHQVGLWSSTGTLLASVTVPSGTGAALTGTSRYVNLTTPVTLAVGTTYTMGAYMGNGSDLGIYYGTANPLAGVTFGQAVVDGGTGAFSRPTTTTGEDAGYFGANLLVTPAQPVPEPATIAILGVGAAALLRRKRRSA